MVPAAVVIVAAVAGGLYFRSRSTTTLTEKDTIVLADFANHTGDPVFDDTLRQGVSVQLSQSPFLSLLPDRKVSDMLKLMGRAPGDGSSSMASFNSGRAGVSPFWCRIFQPALKACSTARDGVVACSTGVSYFCTVLSDSPNFVRTLVTALSSAFSTSSLPPACTCSWASASPEEQPTTFSPTTLCV